MLAGLFSLKLYSDVLVLCPTFNLRIEAFDTGVHLLLALLHQGG